MGSLTRKELGSTDIEILGVGAESIYISQVHDFESDTTDELLTPGQTAKVYGGKIKIADESPDCGVYFVNQSTQERSKVPDKRLTTNGAMKFCYGNKAHTP